jgi:hypothetical protein
MVYRIPCFNTGTANKPAATKAMTATLLMMFFAYLRVIIQIFRLYIIGITSKLSNYRYISTIICLISNRNEETKETRDALEYSMIEDNLIT